MTERQERTIMVAFENQGRLKAGDIKFIVNMRELIKTKPLINFSEPQSQWLYRIFEHLYFQGLIDFEAPQDGAA